MSVVERIVQLIPAPAPMLRAVVAGAAGAAGAIALWHYMAEPMAAPRRLSEAASTGKRTTVRQGELDLKRKALVVHGRPLDHTENVVVVSARGFDLNRTIFKPVEGFIPRTVLKDRYGVELFWSSEAAMRINTAAQSLPKAVPHNSDLIDFMLTKCDFAMEHADGSFMDHLQFCYEYSATHFKSHSPVVLFLHSILGVATNHFPMQLAQLPELQALVQPKDMLHIQAFPSILRLLNHRPLLDELLACDVQDLKHIQAVEFHRVIDNKPMKMDADDFWIHLNYQIIHLLDFLPAANWRTCLDDGLFQIFIELHALLTKAKKLVCTVEFDIVQTQVDFGGRPPLTLGRLISKFVPSTIKQKIAVRAIEKFSAKINHNLQYRIRRAV